MAIHILGRGMGDNVRSPFKRTAVHRGREGVVHDKRYAVRMCDASELLNIKDFHTGIGKSLPEEQFGFWPESRGDHVIRIVRIDESHADAHLFQCDAQQVEGSSVDIGGADDMVAGPADVEAGKQIGGLARRSQHRTHASFQVSDLGCHMVVGRILEPGVEIPALLQIEQPSHLV